MKKIFLDDTLREQLAACPTPLELCDLTGQVVGYFAPVHLAAGDAEAIQRLQLPEELAQLLADNGCQPPVILFDESEQPASV